LRPMIEPKPPPSAMAFTSVMISSLPLASPPEKITMRLPAKDCSGNYRCYRVAKLRQAHLERIISHGYSFQEEVLYRCRRTARCRIGETPIIFEDRRAGSSKVNRHEVIRSLAVIISLGLVAFFGLDEPV